ncbi:hypothetical protein KN63_04385 [Smithella sp. F21]|nr:hypothetical protein KN63_04385 [Smithella sp. F21]
MPRGKQADQSSINRVTGPAIGGIRKITAYFFALLAGADMGNNGRTYRMPLQLVFEIDRFKRIVVPTTGTLNDFVPTGIICVSKIRKQAVQRCFGGLLNFGGQREQILSSVGLAKVSKGNVGNDDQVLESLNRLSLEAWKTKTAALPQQFADARKQADKLLEPKTQHVSLSSGTLRTKEDIDSWIDDTRDELLAKIKKGPVVIT